MRQGASQVGSEASREASPEAWSASRSHSCLLGIAPLASPPSTPRAPPAPGAAREARPWPPPGGGQRRPRAFRSITRRVEQNECVIETKTKDNVFLLARVAVQQSVIRDHAKSAIYELSDVGAQVDSYVADVVRSQLPKMTLDEVFENKDSISRAVQDALSGSMTEYGFTIHKALVTELKPSQEVMNSMNEINKQKRLRDAAQMASEAEKIRVVKKAEADRDAAMLQGEGIARQREAIIEGLRRAVTGSEGSPADALSADRVSELLLITQYFETMKEIGANSRTNTVFMPSTPAEGIKDIASQIRNGILQAAPAAAAAAPRQSEM